MKAGKLRHRIKIEKPVKAQNTFGEVEVNRDDAADWTDFATVWGQILPISSRSEEKFTQDNSQLLAEVDHTITIRYLTGVTHQMRVICGTRIFEISTVLDPDGFQREMTLMCKEQPSG